MNPSYIEDRNTDILALRMQKNLNTFYTKVKI